MRFAALSIIAFCAVTASAQALACKQLISSARLQTSDLVVEGTARCLDRPGVCQLKIDKVVKGDAVLRDTMIEVRVKDAPPMEAQGQMITIGRCPQTFEPWQAVTEGRFYLTGSIANGYFAAHPVDAASQKAE